MISSIRGVLIACHSLICEIEVNNSLGYEVWINNKLAMECTRQLGKEIHLFTHLVIREDQHTLYGFLDRVERDFFRSLIKASGVGPKLALSMLSYYSVLELTEALVSKNIKGLMLVPGVGKKMAERLIIEFKDKVKIDTAVTNLSQSASFSISSEAELALQSLGYSAKESKTLVEKVFQEGMQVEEVIKIALKS